MARPIKETPVITGKDAILFEQRMKEVKPLPPEERERMRKNFEIFKKIATFSV
jgi:hypothetical protein